ncbi:lipid-transfer protein [Striga asiatica]|uniref:Lipid-transfer protein n=1 Tax=Striga asiatica TaxID=4170 RepID=A0A5A7RH41_STRAF|nr:lipid-transfer protein [Striga asiatica]
MGARDKKRGRVFPFPGPFPFPTHSLGIPLCLHVRLRDSHSTFTSEAASVSRDMSPGSSAPVSHLSLLFHLPPSRFFALFLLSVIPLALLALIPRLDLRGSSIEAPSSRIHGSSEDEEEEEEVVPIRSIMLQPSSFRPPSPRREADPVEDKLAYGIEGPQAMRIRQAVNPSIDKKKEKEVVEIDEGVNPSVDKKKEKEDMEKQKRLSNPLLKKKQFVGPNVVLSPASSNPQIRPTRRTTSDKKIHINEDILVVSSRSIATATKAMTITLYLANALPSADTGRWGSDRKRWAEDVSRNLGQVLCRCSMKIWPSRTSSTRR